MNQNTYARRPKRLGRVFTSLDPFYFVTFNTYKRRKILATNQFHEAFTHFAKNASNFGVAVGRYVIMPDHIHFFVMMPREGITISRWMKSLKCSLGAQLKIEEHKGPHWQEGFFDHLLRSGDGYAEKWEYVRQNPVRAGLCRHPDEWPYQGQIVPIRF